MAGVFFERADSLEVRESDQRLLVVFVDALGVLFLERWELVAADLHDSIGWLSRGYW